MRRTSRRSPSLRRTGLASSRTRSSLVLTVTASGDRPRPRGRFRCLPRRPRWWSDGAARAGRRGDDARHGGLAGSLAHPPGCRTPALTSLLRSTPAGGPPRTPTGPETPPGRAIRATPLRVAPVTGRATATLHCARAELGTRARARRPAEEDGLHAPRTRRAVRRMVLIAVVTGVLVPALVPAAHAGPGTPPRRRRRPQRRHRPPTTRPTTRPARPARSSRGSPRRRRRSTR